MRGRQEVRRIREVDGAVRCVAPVSQLGDASSAVWEWGRGGGEEGRAAWDCVLRARAAGGLLYVRHAAQVLATAAAWPSSPMAQLLAADFEQ
eukprot:6196923-Pleurochrysis_carterae.AAC.1